jgi:hypothetical protein
VCWDFNEAKKIIDHENNKKKKRQPRHRIRDLG